MVKKIELSQRWMERDEDHQGDIIIGMKERGKHHASS
jgi:hypothetical protein